MHGISSRPTLLRLRAVCAATARLLFILALVILNYCQVHCSARKKNAETEMSSVQMAPESL